MWSSFVHHQETVPHRDVTNKTKCSVPSWSHQQVAHNYIYTPLSGFIKQQTVSVISLNKRTIRTTCWAPANKLPMLLQHNERGTRVPPEHMHTLNEFPARLIRTISTAVVWISYKDRLTAELKPKEVDFILIKHFSHQTP